MAIQLRDTQFGHLVRLVSGSKLFRYPDENDRFLWKKFILQGTIDAFPESGRKDDPAISNEGKENQTGASFDLQQSSRNHTIENEKGLGLVDWYSSDDPEVSASAYPGQRSG